MLALVTCFLATREFFWHWGVAFFLFLHLWWIRATFSQETGLVILLTGWYLWINLKNWNPSGKTGIFYNEKIEVIRIFWKWGWRQVFVCCFLVWMHKQHVEIHWLRVAILKPGRWTEPLEKIGFPWSYLYPWIRTLGGWWGIFWCRNIYFYKSPQKILLISHLRGNPMDRRAWWATIQGVARLRHDGWLHHRRRFGARDESSFRASSRTLGTCRWLNHWWILSFPIACNC